MNKDGSKLSKLDRFLVSNHFTTKWPNAQVWDLPRELSGHCPLIPKTNVNDFGPPPFKFYNSWLLHDDFSAILIDSWSEHPNSNHPIIIFKEKLKALKIVLKKWLGDVINKEVNDLKTLRISLDLIDMKAENGALNSHDKEYRLNLLKEISDLEKAKTHDLKQKAKVKWVVEGDENTKFFHGIINNKLRRSRINGLLIDSSWVTDPNHIKNHIFDFFKTKFDEPDGLYPSFSSSLFNTLSFEDASFLESSFSSEEIKDAVWDCGNEKAPGPDGFTFKLFKCHWDVVGNDIISFAKNFENLGHIQRGCNSSFIALVPKVNEPLQIEEFRPISLIGSQYKIIAKILANRILKVISTVVSEVQTAYIKGRQIIDGPLLVNEIIAWATKKNEKFMMFKVDFEKAFDSLNWIFLDSVMTQMGFGIKWRNWIKGCLKSAYGSVLVNGSPTQEFQIKKGLRQGDPLSPFLFILAMEALHVTLMEAKQKNIFKGIQVGNNLIEISHLQFADDAFIVREWSMENANNLFQILRCFYMASGLKVNFSKSKLFGVGVNRIEITNFASILGCQASQLPCVYLGIPTGDKFKNSERSSLYGKRKHYPMVVG